MHSAGRIMQRIIHQVCFDEVPTGKTTSRSYHEMPLYAIMICKRCTSVKRNGAVSTVA